MFKGLGLHSTSRIRAIVRPVSWINALSIKWMKSNEPEVLGPSPGSASDSLGSVLSTLQGSTLLSIQWRGCTRWLTWALAAQRFAGIFYELCREWEGLGIVLYSFPRKLCIFPTKGRIQITMAVIYWARIMCHTLMSTIGKKKKKKEKLRGREKIKVNWDFKLHADWFQACVGHLTLHLSSHFCCCCAFVCSYIRSFMLQTSPEYFLCTGNWAKHKEVWEKVHQEAHRWAKETKNHEQEV